MTIFRPSLIHPALFDLDFPRFLYRVWPGDGPQFSSDLGGPATNSDGAFRSAAGSVLIDAITFNEGTFTSAFPVASVDWIAADAARFRLWAPWNSVKTLILDNEPGLPVFDGSRLVLENWVDVQLNLRTEPPAGEVTRRDLSITIDGAKRGTIETGAGDDAVTLLVDSNGGAAELNRLVVDTGAGADRVSLSASATDWTEQSSNAGLNRPYDPRWTTSEIDSGAGNDTVLGGNGIDVVYAGIGDDLVESRGGADRIDLGAGDDTAAGGSGDDQADGGTGLDTWRLGGVQTGYTVTLEDVQVVVRDIDATDGDDGTDRLAGFDRLVFRDGEQALGPQGPTVQVRRLVSGPDGAARGSVVSDIAPDGSRVTFGSPASELVPGSDTNGGYDYFVINLDGTGLRRISSTPDGNADDVPSEGPRFTGDGNWLVFNSESTGLVPGPDTNRDDVFLFDVRSGELTRLSAIDPDAADSFSLVAEVAPSGAALTYFTYVDEAFDDVPGLWTSFLVNLVDSTSIVLPQPRFGDRVANIWSANADVIAYDDVIFDVALEQATRIRTSTGEAPQARIDTSDSFFTPDGSKLVFCTRADNMVPDLPHTEDRGFSQQTYVVNRDGTGLRTLSADQNGPLRDGARPVAISPDGQTVLMFDQTDEIAYLVDIDGSDLRTIGGAATWPVGFSPDGSQVLYNSVLGGAWALYLEDLDGTDRIALPTVSNLPVAARFSSDGTRIAFESYDPQLGGGIDRNGFTDVFVVNVDGTDLLRISSTPTGSAGNAFSRLIDFTADGTGVIFESDATDLVDSADEAGTTDIFVAQLPVTAMVAGSLALDPLH